MCPKNPDTSFDTVNEWQPELWETLPNNQMQGEDTEWDLLQQSVTSTQMKDSQSPRHSTQVFWMVFSYTAGSTVVNQFRGWRGFTDTQVGERFLEPFEEVTRVFNYYCLDHVKYTVLIGNCSSDNAAFHGPVILRAVPWMGEISAPQGDVGSTYPNISYLPNCQTHVLGVQHDKDETNQLQPNTDYQRQMEISVKPQYLQDAEPAGTPIPKANYNQSPLQIYTGIGRDDTFWRGIIFQTRSFRATTTVYSVYIPVIVEFTVTFSGRRWLPETTILNQGHLLGSNQLGAHFSGRHGLDVDKTNETSNVPSRVCNPFMQYRDIPSQALASQNGSTDQTDQLSTSNQTTLLGVSSNPYWRGHTKRGLGEIHQLYKRQRTGTHRDGASNDTSYGQKEQTHQKRGDPGTSTSWGKAKQDMPQISSIDEQHLQTCQIPSTEDMSH